MPLTENNKRSLNSMNTKKAGVRIPPKIKKMIKELEAIQSALEKGVSTDNWNRHA